jgi:hypothetical protein
MWEVSLMVPFDPTDMWMGTVIGSELDSTVEQTTLIILTSMCESHLATTAEMPSTLFPIHNQEDPVWQQCLMALSDPEGPDIHAGVAEMSKYTQYLFNLQHNNTRTVVQQHLWLTAYGQHITGLRHENSILWSGTLPPSDLDRELQVTYCRLIEAEHGVELQLSAARPHMRRWTPAPMWLYTTSMPSSSRTSSLRKG